VPICYTERRLGESKMSKSVIMEAVVRPWVLFLRRIGRSTRRGDAWASAPKVNPSDGKSLSNR
jgi:hypothetical protein